jgi:hypothetical protein
MAEDQLVKGGTYKGYALHRSDTDRLRYLQGKEYTARSYAAGTSRDDAYAIADKSAVRVTFRLQDKHVGSLEEGFVSPACLCIECRSSVRMTSMSVCYLCVHFFPFCIAHTAFATH